MVKLLSHYRKVKVISILADRFLGEEMKLKISKKYFRRLKSCELQAIARKSRKLFKIYGGLHPNPDVDRLYIPRKDGRRGLIVIDCVEFAVGGFGVYVYRSEERLIEAARSEKTDGLEAASILKKAKKEKRLQDWEEKALHGQYL